MRLRESRNLDQALQQVEPKLARNILRTGIRAAANVIRDAGRQGAPQVSGLLRRSIRTVLRRGQLGQVRASVGVFAPSGKAALSKKLWAYYAMWVELGHRIVARRPKLARALQRLDERRRRSAAGGGTVRPRPFLLPALYAKQNEAREVLIEHIRSRLDEVV